MCSFDSSVILEIVVVMLRYMALYLKNILMKEQGGCGMHRETLFNLTVIIKYL